MGIVIGAVAVVFVLALIIFPGVRGKLKVLVGGFLNIFVEDIAKTPEGAKAVFQQLLGSVRDGAEDLRKEVDGAIVVHASRTTTKMSMAEKNAAKAQSDAYLQSLATKYNGKPAIQAPRSGVTFDAPKSKVKEERK